jgi:hypothetical protein
MEVVSQMEVKPEDHEKQQVRRRRHCWTTKTAPVDENDGVSFSFRESSREKELARTRTGHKFRARTHPSTMMILQLISLVKIGEARGHGGEDHPERERGVSLSFVVAGYGFRMASLGSDHLGKYNR